ncbi:hypothetical protein [Maridesulfovibrio sp.]|uniref:hypothetical protein n=1 Tax=Maridesulfovibrio sp. TaxID=2795000 RepID=UPI0029C9C4F4|nr:hypothetical protein [Maridesulfovibrio sp.]
MFKYLRVLVVQVFILFLFVVPTTAHAYLDPGTGSLILQALAAGLVTALAFWGKIVRKFKSIIKKSDEKDS